MSRRLVALVHIFAIGMVVLGLACQDLLADDEHPRRSRRHRRPRTAISHRHAPNSTPNELQQGTIVGTLPPGSVRLRITFLDVGQGDAALLETADGHAAMIDTGPPEAQGKIRATLAAHRITRLDWLLLSHPHLDHIGNAVSVLDTIPVGSVVDPAYPHPIATYDRLLARIQQLGLPFVRARTGGTLALGSVASVEVLQPRDPFITRTRSDANANSIVARITTGNVRVLFTGDAERETEQRLLSENRSQLLADVLKVAHHGSRYGTSPAMLAAVSPRYAVISCAMGNDYGHPHAETLTHLARQGVTFFRTDLQGDITFTTDGAHISFATARSVPTTALMVPGVRESHPAP